VKIKSCSHWRPLIYEKCVWKLRQQLARKCTSPSTLRGALWNTIAGSNGLLKFVSTAKDLFNCISAVAKVLTNLVNYFVHGCSTWRTTQPAKLMRLKVFGEA